MTIVDLHPFLDEENDGAGSNSMRTEDLNPTEELYPVRSYIKTGVWTQGPSYFTHAGRYQLDQKLNPQ